MSDKVDSYIAGLPDWQGQAAAEVRAAAKAAGLSEDFKWGHPMWSSGDGAVCLIKGFKTHMNLAFWRGADMGGLDGRLQPSGGFRMATIKLTGPGEVSAQALAPLIAQAAELNRQHGDPLKMKA